MRRIWLSSAAVVLAGLCVSQCNQTSQQNSGPVTLSSESDSLAYAMGLGYADYLKQLPTDIDLQVLFRAIQDKYEEKDVRLDAQQAANIRMRISQKLQMAKQKEQSAKNVAAAKAFLDKNGKREGVTTTESGLQYEVLTQGSGPKPTADDKVRVHYRGTLLDGTEFDSSYKRGQPAEFGLKRVIKAWTEGVQLMAVGSKYKFYVPSDLAYGPRGFPPKIGADEALIFEVELLDIVK